MHRSTVIDNLYPVVAPLVEMMDYSIVELQSHTVRETLHVSLVVYARKGVNVDECAEIHRTVLPRIQTVGDQRDVHLEVSSPGLTRNFKTAGEFAIFQGREVQVLVNEESEWLSGVIERAGDDAVTLRTANGERTYTFSDIRKARLAFTREGDT